MSHFSLEQPDVMARPGIGGAASIITDMDHHLRHVPILQHCLVLVVEGTKELHGAGGAAMASAGHLVALPAGAQVSLRNEPDPRSGRYRAHALAFDAAVVAAFFNAPRQAGPQGGRQSPVPRAPADPWQVLPPSAAVTEAFERASGAVRSTDLSDALVRHRVQEVLLVLAERGVVWTPEDGDRLAQRLRLMIAGRPDAPWSAADAARIAAVSEATLRRRLAAEGTCFRDILTDARLSHGLMLLQTSQAGIAEIAMACGYDSPSRFASRFRDRFGTPPSGIRTALVSEPG